MALIRGHNNRVYDSTTGKRVDPVEHPELRTPEQLRAIRAAQTPRVEHHLGAPDIGDGNPIRRMIQEHSRRKGIAWQRSDDGKKWVLEREAEADAWDQKRAAEAAEIQRQESVRPLREHAEKQVQAVFDSPEYSVEEVEQAEAAFAAAKAGDRDTYVEWERQHHNKLLDKLATEAAAADSVARQAAERRDAILRSGINYQPEPVPEIKKSEPTMEIPIDRSRVAIKHKVPSGLGVREVTEIVDAE